MNLTKLIPATLLVLIGCSSAPKQLKEPIPVTSKSSPSDAQDIALERQREARMPCSPEWLKKATAAQKKNCVTRSSINQAMDALSTRPSPSKKNPNRSTEQH
jgi:starvation-inducible outer membrane lipoprotein